MPTIQYTAQLDFTDNGTFETGWRIKQGDFGDCEIVFRVVNNGVNMYDASVTPEIVFRRADGASVISNMTPNDGTYKYTFVGNEIAVPGLTLVDVKYTDSEGRISTASCRFTVVEDTLGYDPTGAHTYDNPVSELVETATVAAETAIDSSFKAEGFAVGEQGGVPVEEGSPYYQNNAKYYGQELAREIEVNKQNGYLQSENLWREDVYELSSTPANPSINIRAISNYIPVNEGETYSVKITGNVSTAFYISVFETKNLIKASANIHEFGAVFDNNAHQFTVSEGYSYLVVMYVSMSTPISGDMIKSLKINIEKGNTVSSTYIPYAPSNIELANSKAGITAIGTDESGRTTASRQYAQGEHFNKDGKFCTTKTGVAQGATWTLNTNYVEGTVADELTVVDITSEATFSQDCTWGAQTKIRRCGKFINVAARFKTPTSLTSNKVIITFPSKYTFIHDWVEAVGTVNKQWDGDKAGILVMRDNDVTLCSNEWLANTDVVVYFTLILK